MACYTFFYTAQNPKQEVVINTDLVRAVFWDEPTRSCALVFDDKYAVSVSGTLKEVEGKLRGTSDHAGQSAQLAQKARAEGR